MSNRPNLNQTTPGLPALGTVTGTQLVPTSDPAGNLTKMTLAQQLAWVLANDGSTDVTAATVLSSLPTTGSILFLTSGGTIALLPVGLLPNGSGAGATGHRYWRVNTSATIYGGFTSIAEIAMATSSGGSNVLSGGTSSASAVEPTTPSNTADKALDGNPATYWGASNTLPAWWRYDFGAGRSLSIAEVKITARNDTQNGANTAPSTFTVECSDDGSTWIVRQSYTVTSWAAGATQTFVVP